MGVGERSAIALAMVFHELATNSAKHGALSSDAGSLDIAGSSEGETVLLTCAETGGPALTEQPTMGGFGSKMMQLNLGRELGGSISYDWQPAGLVATLTLRSSALSH
jgi:two-component sensor histidine kinase